MSDSLDTSPSSAGAPEGAPLSPRDDLRLRRHNIAGLFRSSGTRAIILVTGAVLIAAIGMSYLNISKTAPSSDQIAGGAQVGGVPTVTHRPGVNETDEHAALQQQANQAAYERAASKNQSVVPVLTANPSDTGALVLPTQPSATSGSNPGQLEVPVSAPPPTTPALPAAPVLPPKTHPTPTAATHVAPRPGTSTMDKQVLAYLNLWGPTGKSLTQQEFNETGKQAAAPAAAASAAARPSSPTEAEKNAIRYVRAGTFVPGVLITPLDSDAPGPVLAQISSGPLAGARLLGTMSVQNGGILVTFTTISKPGWPSTYPIKAVAMDQADSTALATYINRHYVIKGMGLLGGAFLQGYGQAMQQQGQTTVVNPAGGVVTQSSQLNAGQVMKTAEGSVAQKFGQNLERSANGVQNTIRVQGKDGESFPIRVLFMENF